MNKIVWKHYPASRLRADLREGVDDDALATITIEWPEAPGQETSIDEVFVFRDGASRREEKRQE